jgi:phenol 2-monooxygenase
MLTYQSGAAQGMNTGIHDAVNLAWKLSLVLQEQAPPSLLQTYQGERLPNVQKLINYDKDISRLMTMQLPLDWQGDPKADPNEILGVVMAEASAFTSGLSIAFDENLLNVAGSLKSSLKAVLPGQRAPDALLQKPGTFENTRLHKETPNVARFHIIVFAGNPASTHPALHKVDATLKASSFFSSGKLPISWVTIPSEIGPSAYELLGIMPFGKLFYDRDQIAHERYGVDVEKGGVFVLRPDGWVGTALTLTEETVSELETYFKGVLLVN